MRAAIVAAVMLAVWACAIKPRNPMGGPLQPVFLIVSVNSVPSYAVTYDEDRTVRFSSDHDLRYAKLNADELSELSALLSVGALEEDLAAYEAKSPHTILLGDGDVDVRHGLHHWLIPGAAIGSISVRVKAVLDFSDGATRRLFRESFATSNRHARAVKPNYWLKLTVRPVTHLACARCAPAWPAAYRVR